MKNTQTIYDFLVSEGERRLIRMKKIRKDPLSYFNNIYGSNELCLSPPLNISEIIGRNGSKMLYKDEKWLMKWCERKANGSHKDSGTIKIISNSYELASLNVRRKFADKISVYKREFVDRLENHKKMPLYPEIKDLLASLVMKGIQFKDSY